MNQKHQDKIERRKKRYRFLFMQRKASGSDGRGNQLAASWVLSLLLLLVVIPSSCINKELRNDCNVPGLCDVVVYLFRYQFHITINCIRLTFLLLFFCTNSSLALRGVQAAGSGIVGSSPISTLPIALPTTQCEVAPGPLFKGLSPPFPTDTWWVGAGVMPQTRYDNHSLLLSSSFSIL